MCLYVELCEECICMHICIYVSTYACMLVHVSMCMYIWLCVHMRTYGLMPVFSCLSPLPAAQSSDSINHRGGTS